MGELAFDSAPAGWVIKVILGKGPDGVQVIRQNNDGLNLKGPLPPNRVECCAQIINVFDQNP